MNILGLLLVVVGIFGGLYLGVWVMFIGGIVQVVQSCTPLIIPMGIALGLLRIICASVVGWLCFYILAGLGVSMMRG